MGLFLLMIPVYIGQEFPPLKRIIRKPSGLHPILRTGQVYAKGTDYGTTDYGKSHRSLAGG
jgi:hypothetical protein